MTAWRLWTFLMTTIKNILGCSMHSSFFTIETDWKPSNQGDNRHSQTRSVEGMPPNILMIISGSWYISYWIVKVGKLAPLTQGWKTLFSTVSYPFDQYFREANAFFLMRHWVVTRLNLEMSDVYRKEWSTPSILAFLMAVYWAISG